MSPCRIGLSERLWALPSSASSARTPQALVIVLACTYHWSRRKASEQISRRASTTGAGAQDRKVSSAPAGPKHIRIFPTSVLALLTSQPTDAATVTMSMASMQNRLVPATRQGLAIHAAAARSARVLSATTTARSNYTTQSRSFMQSSGYNAPNASILGLSGPGGPGMATSYFQKPSTPANTIIRFVPQQTAWLVERMGKFNRILEPGLAILVPFIDRIAYVKSLKENAIEIPSQSAITADNVTLELDGVLYTRVFDAYKAR